MNAQIITIGDEILIGQTVDTNSGWIGAELTKLGFTISQITTIADDGTSITDSLTQALKYNKLIIFTGGLGPTKDDITKNTLCSFFNTQLEFNSTVYADVESFLKSLGGKMNPLNHDQALFPKGAKLLRNSNGTAPGIWFEQNGSIIISLPGVPWEMKGIFNEKIVPELKKTLSLPEIVYQTVMVTGIGESPLAIKLEDWENQLPASIKLAYLPSPGLIKLRLGIKGSNKADLQKAVQTEINKLYEIIPENIYSETEQTLQQTLGKLLYNNNKTISTAESCTGGAIAKLITSVPGSSQYFKGSIVAYSNEIKQNLLDVSAHDLNNFGAVSAQVVEAMAIGVKNKLNTDYAIATSGIAGPDGGTEDKPVGFVWIAISGPHGTLSKQFNFGKEREINIKRSAITALNMLRENL